MLLGPLKNLPLAIRIWMPLMGQCYALGTPEELAPGHPDWDATDDPMLCSIEPSEELAPGHPDWDATDDPMLCSIGLSEELAPGHPDWDAPDEPMLCSRTL